MKKLTMTVKFKILDQRMQVQKNNVMLTMGHQYFEQKNFKGVHKTLPFDDATNRRQQRSDDKFAPIRNLSTCLCHGR